MVRNLKVLRLALVAVFAFSAMTAAGASAQTVGKLTADAPVTLIGEETAGSTLLENAFTGGIGSVTCDGSTYTGHKTQTFPTSGSHQLLASGESSVTVTPHYNQANCKAHIPIFGTRPMTVTMNGCDYDIVAGETTSEHTYKATTSIVCDTGKVVEMHIYCSGCSHTEANSICTVKIPPQNNLGGLDLIHTTATDDIGLKGTLTGIKETHTGSLCGTGESSTSKLDVNLTINGISEVGLATAVTITH